MFFKVKQEVSHFVVVVVVVNQS